MKGNKNIKHQEINWVIHYVANGAKCEDCGKEENGFIQFACNAHTHGMEQYNHPDFQVVLNLGMEEVGRILNTMGIRVQSGEKFSAGNFVSGIYEDCDIRLDEVEECGRKVLRVVIPDAKNRFPENKECQYPYIIQTMPTDALCISELIN